MIDTLSDLIDLLPQSHAFIGCHFFSLAIAMAIVILKRGGRHIVLSIGFTRMLAPQGAALGFFLLGERRCSCAGDGTVLSVAINGARGSRKQKIHPGYQEKKTEQKW